MSRIGTPYLLVAALALLVAIAAGGPAWVVYAAGAVGTLALGLGYARWEERHHR